MAVWCWFVGLGERLYSDSALVRSERERGRTETCGSRDIGFVGCLELGRVLRGSSHSGGCNAVRKRPAQREFTLASGELGRRRRDVVIA